MTLSEYEKGYTRLKTTYPDHPLLAVIAVGYSFMACEYLAIALRQKADDESRAGQTLFTQKSRLYSRRAVLSNSFHDAKTDAERADISRQIGAIQTEIIEVRRAIDQFKQTGKAPIEVIRRSHIPASGRAQQKKIQSIRSSISRYKKLIRTETDQEKIKRYERKVDNLIGLKRELSG